MTTQRTGYMRKNEFFNLAEEFKSFNALNILSFTLSEGHWFINND